MQAPIKIVIAEDYPMFREGFRLLFEEQNEIEIAGEAKDGKQLVELVRQLQPDVVVTDIEMPGMNGIEATREIKKEFPAVEVIALTMYGDEHFVADMFDAGASGYLLKNARKKDVIEAIKKVYAGGKYFCESTSMRLAKMLAYTKALKKASDVIFSEKEVEIIKLICDQHASKEIADKVSLTHRTVEKYRNKIMEKIGATNVAGIVVYAMTHGIYKPGSEAMND